jgi:UDP-sulfoquinovose synthase
VRNPAAAGEFRVFNQFTEQFSVLGLAERTVAAGKRAGLDVRIAHVDNPRTEEEEHYYNAKHSKLTDLGLKPHLLDDAALDRMLASVLRHRDAVDRRILLPTIRWKGGGAKAADGS